MAEQEPPPEGALPTREQCWDDALAVMVWQLAEQQRRDGKEDPPETPPEDPGEVHTPGSTDAGGHL